MLTHGRYSHCHDHSLSRPPFAGYLVYGHFGGSGHHNLLFGPTGAGLIVFLLAVGAASLWAAENMRRATTLTIELTEEGLRDSSGEVLARLDDIAGIDRGVFAFKPSNGFLLSTKTPATRVWRPGFGGALANAWVWVA